MGTLQYWGPLDNDIWNTVSAYGDGTLSLLGMNEYMYLTATRMDLWLSVSAQTSAANTMVRPMTISAGLQAADEASDSRQPQEVRRPRESNTYSAT